MSHVIFNFIEMYAQIDTIMYVDTPRKIIDSGQGIVYFQTYPGGTISMKRFVSLIFMRYIK